MSNFSMEDLKKRIQEQTVVSMGMMMPEEHLKSLVDEAVTQFFDPKMRFRLNTDNASSYYASQRQTTADFLVSPFTLMVWEKLTPLVKAIIEEHFTNEIEKVREEVKKDAVSEEFKQKAAKSIAELIPHMAAYQAAESTALAVWKLKDQIQMVLAPHQIYFDPNQ